MADHRLDDRFEIEQVMYAYCRHADRNEPQLQALTFVEDCVMTFSPTAGAVGRDELIATLTGALGRYQATSHAVTNIEIEFTGEHTATAQSIVTAYHVANDGNRWTLHGRYVDEWRRDAGHGWRLAKREIRAAAGDNRDVSYLIGIGRQA